MKLKTKAMKKKEIKQIYKAGMKVKCLSDEEEYVFEKFIYPPMAMDGDYWGLDKDGKQIYLYASRTRTLAEIIELPNVKEVPEYVECINSSGWYALEKSVIYPIDHMINQCIIKSMRDAIREYPNDFEPSTKEAYEAQQEKIKREELLEEAKRMYPVGTMVNSLVPGYKKTISHKQEYSYSRNEIWFNSLDGENNILVYENGKWAEIISTPKEMTVAELEKEGYVITITKK
jgi:hypothetical protein